jgi:hypothetical protein
VRVRRRPEAARATLLGGAVDRETAAVLVHGIAQITFM